MEKEEEEGEERDKEEQEEKHTCFLTYGDNEKEE